MILKAAKTHESVFRSRVNKPDVNLGRSFELWNEDWIPKGQFWSEGRKLLKQIKEERTEADCTQYNGSKDGEKLSEVK